MARGEKAQAAVLSFLADLEREGVTTINEGENITPEKATSPKKEHVISRSTNPDKIPYQLATLDPHKCIPWKFANRLLVNTDSCAELIKSIKLNGQKIPVVVRPKKGVEEGYELICGARRRFACEILGIPVKAVIADLTDQEAVVLMDVENREREDISAYERGLDYKKWVDEGIYKSYAEISEKIGIKKSYLSQLTSIAELPKEIVDCFGSPANIPQRWGYKLATLCKKSPTLKNLLIQKAIDLKTSGFEPNAIYTQLMNALKEPTLPDAIPKFQKIITGLNGQSSCEIAEKGNNSLLINFTNIAPEERELIRNKLAKVIEESLAR